MAGCDSGQSEGPAGWTCAGEMIYFSPLVSVTGDMYTETFTVALRK